MVLKTISRALHSVGMSRRTVAIVAGMIIVVVAGMVWMLPSPAPLCCGGASQMGRFGKLLALRSASGVVVWDAWKQRTWMLPGAGTGAAAAAAQGNAIAFIEGGRVLAGDMHTGNVTPLSGLAFLRPQAVMISGDGRFVAVEGFDALGRGIWRLDRTQAAVSLVSVSAGDTRIAEPVLTALSADGRYVGFLTGEGVWVFDGFRGISWQIWPKF